MLYFSKGKTLFILLAVLLGFLLALPNGLNGKVVGRFRNLDEVTKGLEIVRGMSVAVDPTALGNDKTTKVSASGEKNFTVEITDAYIEAIEKRTIEQSIEVLRRRIDPTGTTEMTLVREGDDRILLQIPGAKNIADIKTRINQTANLSFRMVRPESNSEKAMQLAAQGKYPPGAAYFLQETGGGLLVDKRTKITGAPRINGAITGGSGFIEGSFTQQSAKELSLLLNAGALPAKLIIAEERTVSAELNMALTINIMLIAAALSLLGATLTLPGIAGIILTIGMAVDANVLIFERIREETFNGRPPVNAIETGYRLSLAPILDANITTFIAAATLYLVGSGPIRNRYRI